MDSRPSSMPVADAISNATAKAKLMIEDARRDSGNTFGPENFILDHIFMAFAGIGAQWADKNPENK